MEAGKWREGEQSGIAPSFLKQLATCARTGKSWSVAGEVEVKGRVLGAGNQEFCLDM